MERTATELAKNQKEAPSRRGFSHHQDKLLAENFQLDAPIELAPFVAVIVRNR